jgi:CheY-like chemotaxis protein
VGGTLSIAQPARPHRSLRYLAGDGAEGRASQDEPDDRDEAISAAAFGATATIMLVEDETMVRALLARVLRSRGYWVIEAADGLEALDLAAELAQPVDLLITDVVMPRMGGIDLAAQMVASGYAARILYMTGYSDLTPHGIDVSVAVLRKPFAPRALMETVRRVLDA